MKVIQSQLDGTNLSKYKTKTMSWIIDVDSLNTVILRPVHSDFCFK